MIKYLVHLLFFITLCVVLATCKHEPPPEPPKVCQYDSSIEEMKKWYYFKTGTQWIYQEQTTGELDTVTVYDHADGSDWLDFYEFHTYGGWLVNYWHDPSWSFPCLTTNECTCHKVFRSRFKPGNFVGESYMFLFPVILHNYTYSDGGICQITEMYNEYPLNSNIYYDVAEWDMEEDNSEENAHMKYWVSKNFGVIQIENIDLGTKWSLINSNIIQ
jgi:hypothetical protein